MIGVVRRWFDGSGKPDSRADALAFSPSLLRLEAVPPSPLSGRLVGILGVSLVLLLVWAGFGELDIVAVADGKLVPASYVKIVQPSEQGIVREIRVQEGERVKAGQVLIRMDAVMTEADVSAIRTEYRLKNLALRRIDAQLSGGRLNRLPADAGDAFAQVESQYRANVAAYEGALAQERSVLDRARHDLASAEQTRSKLEQTLPHFVEQERAFEKLVRDGFAGRILANDKARERIEREQDLRAQESVIRSNLALIAQSEKKITQITADYHRQLQSERVEVAAQFERARQDLAKIEHRQRLLELRAPQDGTIKDLATHTAGTVAAPGTILMTLVPGGDERMVAEVWIGNQDVGFVRMGQETKVKLAPFQFQKYGMLDGTVSHVNADATEAPSPNTRSDALTGRDRPMGPLAFRTLVELKSQVLESGGQRHSLAPGMQVSAEVKLGTRTVLEYLLSPVRKAFHEAARER